MGIDIGGAFMDLVLIDDATDERAVGKVLTTPGDPSEAVEKGIMELLEREDVPPLAQTLRRSKPL